VFSRGSFLVLLTAAVAATTACDRREARRAAPLVDDFGAPVHAGSVQSPSRIVSLNPTTTEILFALGAGARLVGRTHWDVWPDSARLVPDVGDGLRPNVEAVLARHPQLVVLYASADNRSAARRLRSAGVDVLALKVDRIEIDAAPMFKRFHARAKGRGNRIVKRNSHITILVGDGRQD